MEASFTATPELLHAASPPCQFEVAATELEAFKRKFQHRKDTTVPRLNEAAAECEYSAEYADSTGNAVTIACLRTLGGVVTRPQTDSSKLLPCVKKTVDTAMVSGLIRPTCQDNQLTLDFKPGIL